MTLFFFFSIFQVHSANFIILLQFTHAHNPKLGLLQQFSAPPPPLLHAKIAVLCEVWKGSEREGERWKEKERWGREREIERGERDRGGGGEREGERGERDRGGEGEIERGERE